MKANNNSFLISKQSSGVLKIIFELLVLIHHLYFSYTTLGQLFCGAAGPIAVAGFILLSGYGVGINYVKKGNEYCNKLLKNRLPKTYLILVVVDICYLVLYYASGNTFTDLFSVLVSVFYLPVFDGFVALSHWIYFLADLIIYYIMFLLFIKIFSKKKHALLLTAGCIFLLDIVIIIVLSIINFKTGSTRYLRACVCFPIGLTLACFNDKVVNFLKEFKYIIFATFATLGFVSCMFIDARPVSEYVTSALFALAVVSIFYGVDFKSKAISYCAELVLYVYVSHEFFLNVSYMIWPNIFKNIRAIIVLLCSVLFAMALNAIIKHFKKRPVKI